MPPTKASRPLVSEEEWRTAMKALGPWPQMLQLHFGRWPDGLWARPSVGTRDSCPPDARMLARAWGPSVFIGMELLLRDMVCAHGNGKQGRWYFQQALAKGTVRHGCVFSMRCTPTEFMTPVAPGEMCAWWPVVFVQVGRETAMVLCQDHLIKRAKP